MNHAGSINKRRAENGEEALWRWRQGRRTEDGTGAGASAVSPGGQVLGAREAGAEDRSGEAASKVEAVAAPRSFAGRADRSSRGCPPRLRGSRRCCWRLILFGRGGTGR